MNISYYNVVFQDVSFLNRVYSNDRNVFHGHLMTGNTV